MSKQTTKTGNDGLDRQLTEEIELRQSAMWTAIKDLPARSFDSTDKMLAAVEEVGQMAANLRILWAAKRVNWGNK